MTVSVFLLVIEVVVEVVVVEFPHQQILNLCMGMTPAPVGMSVGETGVGMTVVCNMKEIN